MLLSGVKIGLLSAVLLLTIANVQTSAAAGVGQITTVMSVIAASATASTNTRTKAAITATTTVTAVTTAGSFTTKMSVVKLTSLSTNETPNIQTETIIESNWFRESPPVAIAITSITEANESHTTSHITKPNESPTTTDIIGLGESQSTPYTAKPNEFPIMSNITEANEYPTASYITESSESPTTTDIIDLDESHTVYDTTKPIEFPATSYVTEPNEGIFTLEMLINLSRHNESHVTEDTVKSGQSQGTEDHHLEFSDPFSFSKEHTSQAENHTITDTAESVGVSTQRNTTKVEDIGYASSKDRMTEGEFSLMYSTGKPDGQLFTYDEESITEEENAGPDGFAPTVITVEPEAHVITKDNNGSKESVSMKNTSESDAASATKDSIKYIKLLTSDTAIKQHNPSSIKEEVSPEDVESHTINSTLRPDRSFHTTTTEMEHTKYPIAETVMMAYGFLNAEQIEINKNRYVTTDVTDMLTEQLTQNKNFCSLPESFATDDQVADIVSATEQADVWYITDNIYENTSSSMEEFEDLQRHQTSTLSAKKSRKFTSNSSSEITDKMASDTDGNLSINTNDCESQPKGREQKPERVCGNLQSRGDLNLNASKRASDLELTERSQMANISPINVSGCLVQARPPHIESQIRDGLVLCQTDDILPQTCRKHICSTTELTYFQYAMRAIHIYWFDMERNGSCYFRIPINQSESSFSKKTINASTDSLLNLLPSCAQRKGLAFLQASTSIYQFLSPSCPGISRVKKYAICKCLKVHRVGPMIYRPIHLEKNKPSEECYQYLYSKYQNHNLNMPGYRHPDQSIRVFHSKQLPFSSPCPTFVVFYTDSLGDHWAQPFLDSRCESSVTDTVSELVTSSLSVFQSGQQLTLFQCILNKSSHHSYSRHNPYFQFILDSINPGLILPDFPEPCNKYLCHPSTELYFFNYTKYKVKAWIPYAHACSGDQCQPLQEQLVMCQKDLMSRRGVTVIEKRDENATLVTLPLSAKIRINVVLMLSHLWSCSEGHGEEPLGRLRATVLAKIWLENADHYRACRSLTCQATVAETFAGKSSSYIIYSSFNDDFMQCQQSVNGTTYKDDTLVVFSFPLYSTSSRIEFIMTNYPLYQHMMQLLHLLAVDGSLEVKRCCSGWPNPLFASFTDNFYYICEYDSVPNDAQPCPVHPGGLWYRKQLPSNYSIFIYRKGSIPNKSLLLTVWLASLEGHFSNTSIAYALTRSANIHHFGRHRIIAIEEYSLHNEIFLSFVAELECAGLTCNTSSQYSLCYDQNQGLYSPVNKPVYLFIIHECSVSPSDEDKIILLLIMHFLETRIRAVSLCRRENMAVIVPMEEKKALFDYNGPFSQVSIILKTMQESNPGWSWHKGDIEEAWAFIANGNCLKVEEANQVTALLGFTNCIYYSNNKTIIAIRPPFPQSYYALVFPKDPVDGFSTVHYFNTTIKITLPLKRLGGLTTSKVNFYLLNKNPVYQIPSDSNSKYSNNRIFTIKAILKTKILALMRNDSQCMRDLITGKFLIHKIKGPLLIGPVNNDLVGSSCFLHLPKSIHAVFLDRNLKKNFTTINKFWPTCLYNMIVANGAVLPTEWSYLSQKCKVQEVLLLCVSCSVTLLTVIGNLLVLLVIFTSGLAKEATFLIRASLAVADLMLGLGPASLAIHDYISLMVGALTLRDLDPDTVRASFKRLTLSQPLGFQQLRFERGGYHTVCGFVFNVSTSVSLLTLALLSMERLSVVLGHPLRHRYTVTGIRVTWILGAIFSFFINWRQNGLSFAGYFDPITKLTLSIGSGASSVSLMSFYTELMLLGIAGLVIIILTLVTLSLLIHNNYQSRRRLTIHSATRDNDMQRATVTFVVMVVMFGLACGLLLIDVAANLANTYPVAHFFAWWLFMAGASWNWAIYTLSGKRFQKELKNTWTGYKKRLFNIVSVLSGTTQ